jgi:alkylation response protein AidB-like acyl-CoA dehydrogenase
MFSEVFFTDAHVPDDARIGDVNAGWRVANTTLQIERSGMGAGGDGPRRGVLTARAGTVAGDLDKRAGDFAPRQRSTPRASAAPTRSSSPATAYIELARAYARGDDPVIRDGLVRLHTLQELIRLNTERNKAAQAAGGDIPGIANFSKLAMGAIVRLQRDLGLQILGARGMLHDYGDDGRSPLPGGSGGSAAVVVTHQALAAQALPIFGGTDQIQRNIISERTLGLPKEPGDLSQIPFSDLPRNG